MILTPRAVEIRHFHLFAGLGGGARGFNRGPLKHAASFGVYRDAEAGVQAAVYRAFDPAREPETLKLIDRRMLRTEQRDLMPPPGPGEKRDDAEPFTLSVKDAWTPLRARWAFLKRFSDLTGTAAPSLGLLVGATSLSEGAPCA